MVSKTQAGTLAAVSIVLAASSAALAQYSASDPRSNIYNNESLRRQDEIRRNEEAAKTQQQYDDGRSSANSRPASSSYDPRGAAELQALRAKLLRMSPLPDERNTLLGRWRVESTGKPKRKDELGQLMGMLANPGGAACHSDSIEISHVLAAMKVPLDFAMGTVRFSTGKDTTAEEIDRALKIIASALKTF